ncbi:MAG TPA: GGDEF domain-containing protein [Acidobacteriaceae bacterium]|nr:GGDEF domain-containing protein [Acidobacteriaceae bacterium]
MHSFVLAGFVSQATFALTLALLAWSDRRTRGTGWLAAACVLQLASTAAKNMLPREPHVSENISAGLLLLVFFFVYMGLRWFVVRRRLASMWGPVAVSATMALILCLGFLHQGAALAAGRAASVVVLGMTVLMLLNPKITSLRIPAQRTAAMLVAVMAILTSRLVLGLHLMGLRYPRFETLGHDVMLLCLALLGFSFIGMFVAETKRRLHEETRMDPLTGLRNRRAFEEIAQREVQFAVREESPLTLLMLDLDHFKQLNDTWGHPFGDRALRAFGGVLLTVTGQKDAVARMGGEEFAVLLPGRSARSALAMAERLRTTVEGLHLSEGEDLVQFTVSVGLSSLRRGEKTLDEMFRRADHALYEAKREGRNRVVLADSRARAIPPARSLPELQPVLARTANQGTDRLREFPASAVAAVSATHRM